MLKWFLLLNLCWNGFCCQNYAVPLTSLIIYTKNYFDLFNVQTPTPPHPHFFISCSFTVMSFVNFPDSMVPTACQTKQQFSNWVINILETDNSSVITLADLRVILQHMGYSYFPTDICDEQGNFKTVAQGVLVVNPSAERISICMDKSGNSDSRCAGTYGS